MNTHDIELKVKKHIMNILNESATDVDQMFLKTLSKLCMKYGVVLDSANVHTGTLRYVRYDSIQNGKLIADFEFK